MQINNPFLITGYISPEYFCDRQKETDTLIKGLKNQINTTLFSIRRLGKTGLINHVINKLKKDKIKCVCLDIMMTKNIHEFAYQFSKAFFEQTTSISRKILVSASEIFRSFSPSITVDSLTGQLSLELKLIRPDEIYTDLENIFEYIKKSNNKYLIAIDEFQQILNYNEKNFEAFLRSKIQFINNASFIFSGSKKNMLLSIFGSYSKPFWQSCSFMELLPIEKEIYFEFILEKLSQGNKIISNEALEFIYSSARGITYFVQLICNYLYNENLTKIEIEDAKQVFRKIINERSSYYINYANLLTRKQYEILSAIAKEGGISQPMGKDFLMEYKLGSASTVKSALDVLIEKEVIYHDKSKYFLSDVLFSEWLKMQTSF
jgi:uncharacterized protein